MADDTALFAHEAEATRERIAATVDDLQHRLSPRTIVNNAVDSISASGTHAIASLRGRAASHPLALAAAGLAVGIAFLARSRLNAATIEYGDSYAAYADYDESYAASLDADDPPAGSARARLDALGGKAHDAVDDNPLAVVVVGIATGALLGAIVPVSEAEHALFGAARARLAAAGHAAVEAARAELDISKFSVAGGTTGIADRAVASLMTVAEAAAGGLARKPVADFTPRSAA